MSLRLPPDFQLETLKDLRHWFMTQGNHRPGTLEMSTEQYLTYKRLVWEADPIRKFMGATIVLNDEGTNGSDHERKAESGTSPDGLGEDGGTQHDPKDIPF